MWRIAPVFIPHTFQTVVLRSNDIVILEIILEGVSYRRNSLTAKQELPFERCGDLFYGVLYHECPECGKRKENRNNNCRIEERFFRAAPRMKSRDAVCAAECAADTSPRLLKENDGNQKKRKRNLRVRQYASNLHLE